LSYEMLPVAVVDFYFLGHMELSPGFRSVPNHQCRLFQTFCLKRTCSLNTSAFSTLEVLDNNCTL